MTGGAGGSAAAATEEEEEEEEKELQREVKRTRKLRKVAVVPVVIGTFEDYILRYRIMVS